MNEHTLKADLRYYITYLLDSFLYRTKELKLNENDIIEIKKVSSLLKKQYLSYNSVYSLIEYVDGNKSSKEKFHFNQSVYHYKNNELDLAIEKLTLAIDTSPCYELALLRRAIIYLQYFLVSAGLHNDPCLTLALMCIGVPVFNIQKDTYSKVDSKYFSMAMSDISKTINLNQKYITETIKNTNNEYKDGYRKLLKEFISIHGNEIFYNKRFKAYFFDFLNGEYKKDANILLNAVNSNQHNKIEEIIGT